MTETQPLSDFLLMRYADGELSPRRAKIVGDQLLFDEEAQQKVEDFRFSLYLMQGAFALQKQDQDEGVTPEQKK